MNSPNGLVGNRMPTMASEVRSPLIPSKIDEAHKCLAVLKETLSGLEGKLQKVMPIRPEKDGIGSEQATLTPIQSEISHQLQALIEGINSTTERVNKLVNNIEL